MFGSCPHLAAHTAALPPSADGRDAAPAWVQLLPYGTFSGRDGRGPYTLRDAAHAATVIAATRAYQKGADIPGDYEHQLLHAARHGGPAPASGWIRDLEARADGLWGRVEWTAAAAQGIGAREYRYISPVFRHDRDGTVTRLVAFALTAVPNLELAAVANADLFSTDEEEDPMDLLKRLVEACGLPPATTDDSLVTYVQAMSAATEATATASAALAPLLGQAADTPVTDVLSAAAQRMASQGDAEPDPAKYVPIAALQDLQDQVAAMSQGIAQDKAAAAVADAKTAGKLPPAMEGWAARYAAQDLDGFLAWANAAPVLVATAKGGGAVTGSPPPKGGQGAHGLTDGQLAVCSQMGLDPAAFAETCKADNGETA